MHAAMPTCRRRGSTPPIALHCCCKEHPPWRAAVPKCHRQRGPTPPALPPSTCCRYTEAGRSEEQNAEGSTRLVYEYKYGKGYGDMSYQSPILHHVLLRNLTPASEYTYSVGELSCLAGRGSGIVRCGACACMRSACCRAIPILPMRSMKSALRWLPAFSSILSNLRHPAGSPADGFSEELTMKVPGTPGDLPLRIAVIGDPGEWRPALAGG